MRGWLLAGLTAIMAAGFDAAAGHEFWLQPKRYFAGRDEAVTIGAFVGSGFRGEAWAYDPSRAVKLELHAGGRVADLKSAATPGDAVLARVVMADDRGAVVVYESNFAHIELPADRFDAYLRDEGLDAVLAARALEGRSAGPGRERYRRCVKTWIQGSHGTRFRMPALGLPLEIVLRSDPNSSPQVEIEVRVDGDPLPDALVRAWHAPLDEGMRPMDAVQRQPSAPTDQGLTDRRGRITLRLEPSGEWLVSTVHMVPAADPTDADWESTWASITFAVTSR